MPESKLCNAPAEVSFCLLCRIWELQLAAAPKNITASKQLIQRAALARTAYVERVHSHHTARDFSPIGILRVCFSLFDYEIYLVYCLHYCFQMVFSHTVHSIGIALVVQYFSFINCFLRTSFSRRFMWLPCWKCASTMCKRELAKRHSQFSPKLPPHQIWYHDAYEYFSLDILHFFSSVSMCLYIVLVKYLLYLLEYTSIFHVLLLVFSRIAARAANGGGSSSTAWRDFICGSSASCSSRCSRIGWRIGRGPHSKQTGITSDPPDVIDAHCFVLMLKILHQSLFIAYFLDTILWTRNLLELEFTYWCWYNLYEWISFLNFDYRITLYSM